MYILKEMIAFSNLQTLSSGQAGSWNFLIILYIMTTLCVKTFEIFIGSNKPQKP